MNNFNVFVLNFVISVPFTYIGTKKLSSHKIGKQKKQFCCQKHSLLPEIKVQIYQKCKCIHI